MEKEARYYQKLENQVVRCGLCQHRCQIPEGKAGFCKVRRNRGGVLYSLDYGHLSSRAVDPIEKKPLYHFLPGSRSLSIASPGCTMTCAWCQNWELSQFDNRIRFEWFPYTAPESVVQMAKQKKCQSIAYTYSEPTVFWEYCEDTGRVAHENGIKNVIVSNGYMTQAALRQSAAYLDAANIDIKAFTEKAYKRFSGASLRQVLDTCVALKSMGVWLEVTTLLIPGVNDDEQEIRGLARFIAEELGKDTPWHLSRFFPSYKLMDVDVTPMKTISKACDIGREAGLKFIYLGNAGVDLPTRCPSCGEVLIERLGFEISKNAILKDACPKCGIKIPGVWSGDEN